MTDPRTGCDPDTPLADAMVVLPTWGEIGLALFLWGASAALLAWMAVAI